MLEIVWTSYGIPLAALAFGAVVYLIAWTGSRRFDQRYGRRPAPGE